MVYYFVQHDGSIEVENNVKGWYSKETNPNMFTNRRAAIREAKKVTKERIKELKEQLKYLQAGVI